VVPVNNRYPHLSKSKRVTMGSKESINGVVLGTVKGGGNGKTREGQNLVVVRW